MTYRESNNVHLRVTRPREIWVNLVFKHIHAASSYTIRRQFVPFILNALRCIILRAVAQNVTPHCYKYKFQGPAFAEWLIHVSNVSLQYSLLTFELFC